MHFHGTTPNRVAQEIPSTTRHGFLAALGWVAQRLGLREALESQLQVKQKTVRFSPVDKMVEALVGILGNCRYMKDLNWDPEPIVADQAVSRAWGQTGFAHFSTVCGTFAKLTGENVQQLRRALAGIQAPLLQQQVQQQMDRQGFAVIDVDLTSQPVRGESKQYTGTDFGYIQGKLARGYQIVAAFLTGSQERFAVDATLKSGKAATCAGTCLLELLPAVEAQVGRPRRRVEWVQACLDEQKARMRRLHQELARLSGPGSTSRQRRLRREMREAALAAAELVHRLRQYRQDNLQNSQPRRLVLRADSAFGTPAVIQRLLEMGYDLALKWYSGSNPAYKRLFDALPPEEWLEVESKRFASEQVVLPCPALLGPFPLRLVALRRADADGREVRSVVVTTLSADALGTGEVVRFYHRRQGAEAGFQEWKGTFHFGAPRLRKYEANAAFTHLVLFAFNLLRWARQHLAVTSRTLAAAKSRLLVEVAARCRASLRQVQGTSCLLFSRGTPLAGARIVLLPVPTERFRGYSRET